MYVYVALHSGGNLHYTLHVIILRVNKSMAKNLHASKNRCR